MAGAVVVKLARVLMLGTGVRLREFAKVGPRPFVLAAASTLVVGLTALGGVALAH